MRYVLKKLAVMLATLLVLSFLSFAAFEMIGDPVTTILGTNATPEAMAELRAEMGLDRPLFVRYLDAHMFEAVERFNDFLNRLLLVPYEIEAELPGGVA